jgi:hypothetical protein
MKARRARKDTQGSVLLASWQAVSSRQPLRKRLARREKAPQLRGFIPRKACAAGAFTGARSQQGRVNEFGFFRPLLSCLFFLLSFHIHSRQN